MLYVSLIKPQWKDASSRDPPEQSTSIACTLRLSFRFGHVCQEIEDLQHQLLEVVAPQQHGVLPGQAPRTETPLSVCNPDFALAQLFLENSVSSEKSLGTSQFGVHENYWLVWQKPPEQRAPPKHVHVLAP